MYQLRSRPYTNSTVPVDAVARDDIKPKPILEPVSAHGSNRDVTVQSLPVNNIDSDSELTDLSDAEIAELEPSHLEENFLSTVICPKDPANMKPFSKTLTTGFRNLGMDSDATEVSSDNSGSDESDERPRKRMKVIRFPDAAISSTPTHDKSAPASSNDDHLALPPFSSTSFDVSAISNTTPPLYSCPSHPSAAETPTTSHDKASPTQPKDQSLKMVILPRTEVDTLKSHNGILRSHNLSLARQNATLRHENYEALLAMQEIKENTLGDHGKCISKLEHSKALDDKDKLIDELEKARYESQLYKECGFEWARRENLWDVERQLLKNEVSDLVARVNHITATENELVNKMRALEAAVNGANQRAHIERVRAERLRDYIGQMQAQATAARVIEESTNVGSASGSAYPEL